jgi:hypothetical protein
MLIAERGFVVPALKSRRFGRKEPLFPQKAEIPWIQKWQMSCLLLGLLREDVLSGL